MSSLGAGFELDDVQIATPIGREVLVDVRASRLCHTDLLFAAQDIIPMPAVLGHELAGVVTEVGPDVVKLRVADHVVGSLAQSSRMCTRWLSGRPFPSYRRAKLDSQRDWVVSRPGLGGFAERALIQGNQLASAVCTGGPARSHRCCCGLEHC
jgi:S-(hydroxymethyl)glutathione dehydrogenase / alcohol dehydrogenase